MKSALLKSYSNILILSIFGIIYCLISLVNHYNFRTYGFDLGMYNNTLFDYSLFQKNDNPVMFPRFNNVLSDHLSLYHFVFAPLRYVFGTWTLLLIQISSILFGALGIKKIIEHLTENKTFASISMIHFLSMWGIFSALSFDYHDNVVAAMFIPWLIRYILQKKTLKVWIWTIIILVSKENMSLWLVFIFIGMGIWKYKDPEIRKIAIIGSLVSIIYFVVALKIIMPAFANPGKKYAHLKYEALGLTKQDILYNLFCNPKYIFRLLFENHTNEPFFNGIKLELHFMILVSGGLALLYKPQFLIMLLPIYAQKLFHSSFIKWGINYQYSIEFAPILTIAFFYWIYSLSKSEKHKKYLLIGGTIICLLATISVVPKRTSKWYDYKSLNILSPKHYSQNFDVKKVHEVIKTIPKDAKVCTQNPLIPHLSLREDIYMFPNIQNADYIILLPKGDANWPLSDEEFQQKIKSFKNDSLFETFIDTKDILVFKRK